MAGIMTATQRSMLRARMRDDSDEDKWSGIYCILFPGLTGADIPSPYYLDDDASDDASGASEASRSRAISQDYERFLNNDPPRDLVEEFKDEFRRAIASAGDVNGQVDKMSEVAWKLQISIWRRYVHVSDW